MTEVNWPDRLAERQVLVHMANNVPDLGSEEEHDAQVNAYCRLACEVEDEIFNADPADAAALGVQVQLALTLWSEQAPLEPRVRTLLEGLAAALVLTPVSIHPSDLQHRRAA